ncbi:hypothetical protein LEP1GSC016_1640 [Leptospira borgpetersenii serovar Hardjo-bovis str. Sponselee]|uniref:Uncharacterized protein n=1 Tax=Leptospira borgpetersenii serovar Hardjo-bovis str. Sponselee TaxID=1303729 RepID=M6BGE8_LEPBO|nr:hypothetical protein LEP1GSC016_1640 [Leptospira borgpetersenii serovar Hardjo-bovis str. Sponselee]
MRNRCFTTFGNSKIYFIKTPLKNCTKKQMVVSQTLFLRTLFFFLQNILP